LRRNIASLLHLCAQRRCAAAWQRGHRLLPAIAGSAQACGVKTCAACAPHAQKIGSPRLPPPERLHLRGRGDSRGHLAAKRYPQEWADSPWRNLLVRVYQDSGGKGAAISAAIARDIWAALRLALTSSRCGRFYRRGKSGATLPGRRNAQ
jgi:hypothetical protein